MKTNDTPKFKVLGINDDEDFCMCCGKVGLAKVVWVEDMETGEIKHFGTTCAKQPAKGFNLPEIKKAERAYKSANQQAHCRAHQLYKKAGAKYTPIYETNQFGGKSIVGQSCNDMDLYKALHKQAWEEIKAARAKILALKS